MIKRIFFILFIYNYIILLYFLGLSSASAATCVEYNDDATCKEYDTYTQSGCQVGTRFFPFMDETECDYEGGYMTSREIETSTCKVYNDDATCKTYQVDGGWSAWSRSARGTCNSSTGQQSRSGSRTCTNPSPSGGGASCTGSSTTTQTRNCAVNGGWSSRSTGSWSSCNSSTGTQSRTDTRTCTNPTPKNGGSSCSGSSTRVVTQNCKVNGGWSARSYSARGSCNTTTGTKSRTGTRYCNNPTPQNGGADCSGSNTYTDTTTCLVNASCGSSNNSCSVGNYSDISDSGGYSRWQCIGLNGGSSDTCSYRTDYSAPSGNVSYSPSGWTNGNVVVTVSCSDSGGAGCSQSSYSKTVTSNSTGYITISDNLGNTRNIYYNVNNIDRNSPNGSVSHNTGWYNSTQTISFGATDTGGSRVKRMRLQRSLNGGSYQYISGADYNNLNSNNVTRSYNQSALNSHEYRYRLIIWDYAGNSSFVYGPSSELQFDTVAPSNPTISSSSHSQGIWTNVDNANFSISQNNAGPSPFSNYYCFDTNNNCVPNTAGNNASFSNISDGSHYFRARTCDTGGCSSISSFEIKIDTVAPNYYDISVSPNYPHDGADLHANYREFSYFVDDNNFAPIVEIQGYLEDADNPDNYSQLETSNSNTLTFLGNVTKVDNDLLVTDGKRMYTFVITKISDSAGNSIIANTTTPIKTYKYYIYANPDSNLQTSIIENQLSEGNVANGNQQYLTLRVLDAYGNRIIPKENIGRSIDFVFNGQNTLKLDQYNPSTSQSSVFLKLPKSGAGFDNNQFFTGNNTYSNLESNTGKYEFIYKIYSPSFDATDTSGQEFVNGNAMINGIKVHIKQNSGVNLSNKTDFESDIILNSSINFDYKPMVVTQFQGDFSRNYSINQDLNNLIGLTTNDYRTTTNQKVYVGFGYPDTTLNSAHDYLDMSINGNKIAEGHNNAYTFDGFSDKSFQSEIKQNVAGLTDEQKLHYISTHIGYTLDGYNILYDSDIVGKSNYSHGTAIDTSSNLGVKILGIAQSSNQADISQGQTGTDIFQIGNNSKAGLKEQIKKNVAEISMNVASKNISILRNISGDTWDSSIDAPKLVNNRVLLTHGDVKIEPDTHYTGNKTIVVKGGNLYITKNIISENKSQDNLGIIVLEDENNNGGNIYIDPSVTSIQATIYADKSILNYDGNQVVTDSTLLTNQIYFYGSLFTQNTLGGYVALVCPYYIESCSYQEAEKYDLNFLRSYYVYDADGDGVDDESNGNSFFTYPHSNFRYPVIVEYNPNIQNNPPELFEINQ